jgi:hypothetical protein
MAHPFVCSHPPFLFTTTCRGQLISCIDHDHIVDVKPYHFADMIHGARMPSWVQAPSPTIVTDTNGEEEDTGLDSDDDHDEDNDIDDTKESFQPLPSPARDFIDHPFPPPASTSNNNSNSNGNENSGLTVEWSPRAESQLRDACRQPLRFYNNDVDAIRSAIDQTLRNDPRSVHSRSRHRTVLSSSSILSSSSSSAPSSPVDKNAAGDSIVDGDDEQASLFGGLYGCSVDRLEVTFRVTAGAVHDSCVHTITRPAGLPRVACLLCPTRSPPVATVVQVTYVHEDDPCERLKMNTRAWLEYMQSILNTPPLPVTSNANVTLNLM